VWVENRKIASIGVGVRHWITMHGFALNVSGDLSPFDAITPCGIANVTMTSIEKETGAVRDLEQVAAAAVDFARDRITTLGNASAHHAGARAPKPAPKAFGALPEGGSRLDTKFPCSLVKHDNPARRQLH
jgi:hypothetical protein